MALYPGTLPLIQPLALELGLDSMVLRVHGEICAYALVDLVGGPAVCRSRHGYTVPDAGLDVRDEWWLEVFCGYEGAEGETESQCQWHAIIQIQTRRGSSGMLLTDRRAMLALEGYW